MANHSRLWQYFGVFTKKKLTKQTKNQTVLLPFFFVDRNKKKEREKKMGKEEVVVDWSGGQRADR